MRSSYFAPLEKGREHADVLRDHRFHLAEEHFELLVARSRGQQIALDDRERVVLAGELGARELVVELYRRSFLDLPKLLAHGIGEHRGKIAPYLAETFRLLQIAHRGDRFLAVFHDTCR